MATRSAAPAFQFHKGTIKTRFDACADFCFNLFQFHKGTIKTSHGGHCGHALRNFNSIKVRLKRVVLGGGWWCPRGFQFHKGTIKTGPRWWMVVSSWISIP